jgi:hypothetical protein
MRAILLLLLIIMAGCSTSEVYVNVTMREPVLEDRHTISALLCDEFVVSHMRVWRDVVDLKYAADLQKDDYAYWFWVQVQRLMSDGLIKDTHNCLSGIPQFRAK